MLTTLSRNLMPFYSFSPIEIAKIKRREILSRENRKIKYARNDVRIRYLQQV